MTVLPRPSGFCIVEAREFSEDLYPIINCTGSYENKWERVFLIKVLKRNNSNPSLLKSCFPIGSN